MEGKLIKVAYLQPKQYKEVIDIQTDCKRIDEDIIRIAWKRLGQVLVVLKDPNEPISRTNIRKPTQAEWEDLVLYARNKCRQLDRTYFLKDPDPMSKINGYQEEQPVYIEG